MPHRLLRMSKTAYKKPRPRTKTPAYKANTGTRNKAKTNQYSLNWSSVTELCSLIFTLGFLTLLFIGYLAKQFSGTDLLTNLLPFSFGLVACIVLSAWLLRTWGQVRIQLHKKWRFYPLLSALALSAGITAVIAQQGYWQQIRHFKTLVGGKQLVQTENVAHQVYAAYRRQDPKLEQQLIERAQAYRSVIHEAARQYGLDPDLLMGLATAESSFLPRDSHDGGHGLFQITAVAGLIQEATRGKLGVKHLDLNAPQHNAYLAAATLKFYLSQMQGDLYLGLLAYNMGPKNGGLRFIMDQYGAHDFVSMQPYLQTLPRDYPIRVLSHALAFKIWQQHGKLLAYQEAQNAPLIQSLGIPGMKP